MSIAHCFCQSKICETSYVTFVCVQLKVVGEGGDPEAHDDEDEHSHH
jgi:hypothetical protein